MARGSDSLAAPPGPEDSGAAAADAGLDVAALRAELAACAARHGANAQALARPLKAARARGLDLARARLARTPRRGRACAQRLGRLQDVLLQVLHETVSGLLPPPPGAEAARLAVLAVGGFGRGTLAPHSDVDLLFLRPPAATAWTQEVVETMLHVLWGMGLKVGHATRHVRQGVRLAREDMTVRTAVLDARPVCGDAALWAQMSAAFDREVVRGTGRAFIAAKLAERDARHHRAGISRYLVEPDVKDGKGALRDLHALVWIAKYCYRTRAGADLVSAGLFTPAEQALFGKCEDFLWAVRCQLHFLTGRAEERITFDLQSRMAHTLGYHDGTSLRAVERFMKHYFLVAKHTGDLTRTFCAVLEDQHKKAPPGLDRMRAVFGPRLAAPGFSASGGRLNVTHDGVFAADPVNLLRLFRLADRHGLGLHPHAARLARRCLSLAGPALRRNPEANAVFLDILTSRRAPERALRKMNEIGVLGRFVPDFGRIVALMQFNMYHHYTADEHLLRAIGILSDLEQGRLAASHPLAHAVIAGGINRKVLYAAVFLHDIAKGRAGDHSRIGARIAVRLCARLGFSGADTQTVSWLVRHHLAMSDAAQTRDVTDERTVADFAALVQSPERLRLLLVLTAVDIHAVGPGVWNGWKEKLLSALYHATDARLAGGDWRAQRAGAAAAAHRALRRRLRDWPRERFAAYLALHYPAYWTGLDADLHARHARLIMAADTGAPEALTVRMRADPARSATEIIVYAPDHPGLFARLACACAVSGADIADAKIFTTRTGMAVDTLWVRDPEHGAITDGPRLRRLEANMGRALAGALSLPQHRARLRPGSRRRAFSVAPQVLVDNTASDTHTVVEVAGLSRPGLLHALAEALFRLGLTISSAHATTYGERAVDVFYVRDVMGHKVTLPGKRCAVERSLLAALDPAQAAPAPDVSAAAVRTSRARP